MIHLWCLHGNLQTWRVWPSVLPTLSASARVQLHFMDLWSMVAPTFADWVQDFAQRVAQTPGTHVLLGYSLGGRLAMHAIVAQPQRWAGAILVSADPGGDDDLVRAACLERDQRWGQRFLTEPWEALLAEWDQLPVFQGRANTTVRAEQEFSRLAIARYFDRFSKGRQMALAPALQTDACPPLLYLSGACDRKYAQIGQALAHPCDHIRHISLANVGHRVPWESPAAFEQAVAEFLTPYF